MYFEVKSAEGADDSSAFAPDVPTPVRDAGDGVIGSADSRQPAEISSSPNITENGKHNVNGAVDLKGGFLWRGDLPSGVVETGEQCMIGLRETFNGASAIGRES